MAEDRVAWMIGGATPGELGPEHSPEIVRQAHYDAMGGAEGVSSVGALEVKAQGTPSTTVRVLPGGATLLNRYEGGAGQAYSARNKTQTNVAIQATNSAGSRTDLVVLRILDPQYEGQPPADVSTFQYVRLEVVTGVPVATKTAAELNLGYPAIELARIQIPASTETITNAMITDLRRVARPKREEVLRTRATLVTGSEALDTTSPDGEYFPDMGAFQEVDIPEWATRAIIEATWMQVRMPGSSAYGEVWVSYGPWVTVARKYSTQRYNWDDTGAGSPHRQPWEVADDVYIPSDIRGTTQRFTAMARLAASTPASERPTVDARSGFKMRITFLEVADRSTT